MLDFIVAIFFFVGFVCGMMYATINSIIQRKRAEQDLNNYLINRSQIFNKSDLENGWELK